MDTDYKKVEKAYRKTHKITEKTQINRKELQDFPIERARLQNIWWIILTFVGTVAAFEFSLGADIDLPLLLQFLSKQAIHYCLSYAYNPST
jgi:hypothetical protein